MGSSPVRVTIFEGFSVENPLFFTKKCVFYDFDLRFPQVPPKTIIRFLKASFCGKPYVSKIGARVDPRHHHERMVFRSDQGRGFHPAHLSIPAFLDPGSRQKPSSAHIRLSACAGLPAPWLNHKTPEGGFRTRGLARELLSIQAALGRLPLFLRFAPPRH